MPLHQLHEKPNTQATWADLTFDSDGKIEHFIGPSGKVESVLSVHHLCEGEPYYMGFFLAGVYQVYSKPLIIFLVTKNFLYVRFNV